MTPTEIAEQMQKTADRYEFAKRSMLAANEALQTARERNDLQSAHEAIFEFVRLVVPVVVTLKDSQELIVALAAEIQRLWEERS